MSKKTVLIFLLVLGLIALLGVVARSYLDNVYSGVELVEATYRGDYQLVERLVRDGHDVNRPGRDSWTPLTTAIEKNDIEMVRLLLDLGADPNLVVPGGTALDMAIRREREELRDLLESFNAKCQSQCAN